MCDGLQVIYDGLKHWKVHVMLHGGDIYRNDIVLDFSVNINPLGRPAEVDEAIRQAFFAIENYPDPRHEKLLSALALYAELPEKSVIAGNGASELIMAVMRLFQGRRVFIPAPSFSGYKYAAEAAELDISYIYTAGSSEECYDNENVRLLQALSDHFRGIDDEALSGSLLVVTNPNNPDGRLMDEKELSGILELADKKGIMVLMDESFIGLTGKEDGCSLKRYVRAGRKGLMVLDSFTKSFALPGVRLGMLYTADENLKAGLAKLMPEWNISCFADAAGIEASKHRDFLIKSAEYISNERKNFTDEIKNSFADAGKNVQIFDSAANYILFKSDTELYDKMLFHGILIRDCSDYPGLTGKYYYRAAVRKQEDNMVFIEKLRECLK